MVDAIRMTAIEYFATMPETTQPTELIRGELIVSPSPVDNHQYVVSYIAGLFFNAITQTGLGQYRVAPSEVHLSYDTVVQPDIFFVAKNNSKCVLGDDGYWQGSPDLAIEVLSPATAKRDRDEKFSLYEEHGVREYWLVDPQAKFVEAYQLEDQKFNRIGVFGIDDKLPSVTIANFVLEVNAIFPSDDSKGK